jgi:hypothetical protein
MAGDKPTAAFVLSLIGGIFVLLGGIALAVLGSLFAVILSLAGMGGVAAYVTILGAIGAISGIIMIVGGVMMYSKPQTHTMWGAIILVLAILSIFTAIWGFFLGFILGLIGGILGLAFKPSQGMPMMQMQPPMAPPSQ